MPEHECKCSCRARPVLPGWVAAALLATMPLLLAANWMAGPVFAGRYFSPARTLSTDAEAGDLRLASDHSLIVSHDGLWNPTPAATTLGAGDNRIGGVEIVNSDTDTRASVLASAPTATDPGLVVREVDAAASLTALQLIDDIVSGSEAQVDVVTFPDNEPFNVAQLAGTATSVNAGTLDAGTLRVALATDDELNNDADDIRVAVELIDNAIAGTEMQVDVVAALPAGDNNVGNVDIVTFPDNEPFNVAQVAGTATSVNAGTNDAGTQRFTLATDDELNDDADSIRVAVELIDNAIAGTEMQVDVVAALPAGSALIGSVVAFDNDEYWVDSAGTAFLIQSAFTSRTTAGADDIEVVAAQGAGNSILVLEWMVASDTSIDFGFESDGGGGGSNDMHAQVQNQQTWTNDHRGQLMMETDDNESLELDVSAAADVSVTVRYVVR